MTISLSAGMFLWWFSYPQTDLSFVFCKNNYTNVADYLNGSTTIHSSFRDFGRKLVAVHNFYRRSGHLYYKVIHLKIDISESRRQQESLN